MVRKTTPVRTTLATTNTTMMLKSASVLPGAVTKNGTCAVAAGLGEAVKGALLPVSGACRKSGPSVCSTTRSGLDLDQSGPPWRGLNPHDGFDAEFSSGLI